MNKLWKHLCALALIAVVAGTAGAETTYLCQTGPAQTAGPKKAALCEDSPGAALPCRFQDDSGRLTLFTDRADSSGLIPADAGKDVLYCRPDKTQGLSAKPQEQPAFPKAQIKTGLLDNMAGANLAVVNPAAFFDGNNANGREMGASSGFYGVLAADYGADGAIRPVAAGCTPGVDCPSNDQKPKRQLRCTPGVDCPSDDQKPKRQPRCTPGVDCPKDEDTPDNGRTPLPPNYRPRPESVPDRFPSYDNSPVPYDSNRVDEAGYWHEYRVWGEPVFSHGSWEQSAASAQVKRGGSETGFGQGTAYATALQSQAQCNVYKLNWRYVGRDCDPNDSNSCLNWEIEYRWFYDGIQSGKVTVMNVEVEFQNDQKLLPWEEETFDLSFDGSKVSIQQTDTAFSYQVRGPLVDQQRGTASITLVPGARRLRAPEASKVALSLIEEDKQLKLIVDDARTEFYDGTTLEVDVTVKFEKGFWHSDALVSKGILRISPVRSGDRRHAFLVEANQGPGSYYIKSWNFRRLDSKISSPDWISKGKGNTVKY